jgi:DNA-binding response OmpR family regulator
MIVPPALTIDRQAGFFPLRRNTAYDAVPLPAASVFAFIPQPSYPAPTAVRPARTSAPPARTAIRFDGWALDLIERRLVAPGGGVQQLPGLEFALLKIFVEHARRRLTRTDLAKLLTRDGKPLLSGRTVDSYVSRLRRRLRHGGAASLIATVREVGYRFDADLARR